MTDQPPQILGRRERNKLRNRREMVEAALEEFAEHGYHDTSIQDIAVRAEFAVGSIYALFGSKEELYRTILMEHANEATELFTIALQTGSNEYEQLWNYVEAKGRLYENKIKLARLIFTETLGTGVIFKNGPNPELKMMYAVWHEQLAEMFRAGIEKKIFHPCDPLSSAVALEGITNQLLYQWQEDPDHYSYQSALTSVRRIIFDPLLISETNTEQD